MSVAAAFATVDDQDDDVALPAKDTVNSGVPATTGRGFVSAAAKVTGPFETLQWPRAPALSTSRH